MRSQRFILLKRKRGDNTRCFKRVNYMCDNVNTITLSYNHQRLLIQHNNCTFQRFEVLDQKPPPAEKKPREVSLSITFLKCEAMQKKGNNCLSVNISYATKNDICNVILIIMKLCSKS